MPIDTSIMSYLEVSVFEFEIMIVCKSGVLRPGHLNKVHPVAEIGGWAGSGRKRLQTDQKQHGGDPPTTLF